MAVTAPVSLTKIKTEFNGPNTFSSYIRGGTYVPDTTPNAAISTTEANLAMSTFLGAAAFAPFTQTFTSGSSNVTAPVGATQVTITLWGGGAGGGGGMTVGAGENGGGGGGSGAQVIKTVSVTGGSTVFSYSVGTGGAGGPEEDVGYNGIDSTVSCTSPSISLTAQGGNGGNPPFFDGVNPPENGIGGPGGLALGGDTNNEGNQGFTSTNEPPPVNTKGGTGASAPNGGAGGAGGSDQTTNGNGGAGSAPGAGGGGGGATGTAGGDNGGAGARGEIQFYWFN